ncbi:MAG: hypothetical protein GY854_25480 [Deltaproteobacteria bacterium]|nr:hypothetical protein [Deltaproteobacteria bacterium]
MRIWCLVFAWSTLLLLSCGGHSPSAKTKQPSAKKSDSKSTPSELVIAQGSSSKLSMAAAPEKKPTKNTELGLNAPGPRSLGAAGEYSLNEPLLTIDNRGHMAKIRDLAFSADGRYLVSVSYDKTVRIWRTSSGYLVRTIRGQIGSGPAGSIYAAAVSNDNNRIALGGFLGKPGNQPIMMVSFHGYHRGLFEGHRDVVFDLAFSKDGKRLVSGSADRDARIWDVEGKHTIHVLKGHADSVMAVATSPDDRIIATGSRDKTVKLWDAYTGRELRTLRGHKATVRAVAFSPDGRYLLTGGSDKKIRLWDARKGRLIRTFAKQKSNISSLSVSPDSRRVISGCSGGNTSVNVYEIPTGKRLLSFDRHDNIVLATAISSDGVTVATGGGNDHEIFLWDINSGAVKKQIGGEGKTVWSVGFGNDGNSIAWGKRFDQTGYNSYQLNGPLERSFSLRAGGVAQVGLGPILLSDTGYTRALESMGAWSVQTVNRKVHRTLQISKGGRVVSEIVRDATSGFDHRAYTLTPDARYVISGGANGELAAYDVSSGRIAAQFKGHSGDVLSVAVSPDSKLLVSGSSDQTVRVWNVATGKLLLSIFETKSGQWVAWIPEGYYTSSYKGDTYIGWHTNRGANSRPYYYSASSYSNKLRSHDVVEQYLNTNGQIKSAIERANSQSYSGSRRVEWVSKSNLAHIAPPSVTFEKPNKYDTKIYTDSVRIKAKAASPNSEPITDIWLLVNGRPIGNKWKMKPKKVYRRYVSKTSAEVDMEIPLAMGTNRITVMARNQYTRSEPVSIEIERHMDTPTRPGALYRPNLYLLSIGVSTHRASGYDLDFADLDAAAVTKTLKKQEGKLYKKVLSKTYTNRKATKRNIINGLNWLYRETTQNDVAIIYIAGHGFKDSKRNYYFFPYDGKESNLEGTAVKWTEFQKVLENLPSKIILMADTCHSGAVTGKSRGRRRATIYEALRQLVDAGTGVVVLTSSTGKERSWEARRWKHGAFTKAFLEGLTRKADVNKDKIISVKELDLYITERVKKLTNGNQHTTTEIPRTLPDFPIAYW